MNIDEEKFTDFLFERYGIKTEPGRTLNYPGYVRVQFCASKETIKELIKRFKQALEWISEGREV